MSHSLLAVPEADLALMRGVAPHPRVAIVLGSGLAGLAAVVADPHVIPYADLAGVPRLDAVPGHAGELVSGTLEGVPVALFSGRVHLYQGASALEAAYPARLAAALGCETLIVTNASGSVSELLDPGHIVLISDHINLMGASPLTGWGGPEGGGPFVPMRDAYDPDLRAIAFSAAATEGIDLHDGVYAGLPGPAYETPAEAGYLRRIGADIVGMSTVPEVIAARALGLRVLGISLVANIAAGEGLSHADVLEAGRRAAGEMSRLVLAILRGL